MKNKNIKIIQLHEIRLILISSGKPLKIQVKIDTDLKTKVRIFFDPYLPDAKNSYF